MAWVDIVPWAPPMRSTSLLARAIGRFRALLAMPPPHPARFLEHLPGSSTHNDHGTLRRFLSSVPPAVALLDLGSGDRRLQPGTINVDIARYPAVDVVGDAHRLPFRDASFGAVVLQTVLEHVLEPGQVIGETARVLVPGGRAYIEAPFLYPVHGVADYYRWTLRGLEYVVGKHLEVLESGLTLGPASALSLTWRGFLDARLHRVHWSIRNGLAWMTAWLPRVEGRRIPDAVIVYATCFVVARRPA